MTQMDFRFIRKNTICFFQYHPFSKIWGPMHWGHCKSSDFIRWEYLPVAMAPDEKYDAGGCYSGSAIEIEGEHVLLYTGVTDRYLEDGTHDYCQVQCMSKGDGLNYSKYKGNPVIAGKTSRRAAAQKISGTRKYGRRGNFIIW